MPTKAPVRVSKPSAHPVRDAADALFRSAGESCHQHGRLKRVLAHGAEDPEFQSVCDVTELSDKLLAEQMTRYERAADEGRRKESEDWWRAANALWMASREYARRRMACDAVATRFKRHTAAEFGEITLEYELEMSARMALKQAIATYAKLRPDAA